MTTENEKQPEALDAEALKELAADYANEMACEATSTTNAWPDIEAAQKKLYDAIDASAQRDAEQRKRIAELEAQLEAVGAGGVSALMPWRKPLTE